MFAEVFLEIVRAVVTGEMDDRPAFCVEPITGKFEWWPKSDFEP